MIGSVTIVRASQIAEESVNEPLDLLGKLPGVFTEQFNQCIISSDAGVRGFNSQGEVAPLLIDELRIGVLFGDDEEDERDHP